MKHCKQCNKRHNNKVFCDIECYSLYRRFNPTPIKKHAFLDTLEKQEKSIKRYLKKVDQFEN